MWKIFKVCLGPYNFLGEIQKSIIIIIIIIINSVLLLFEDLPRADVAQ